MSFVCVCGGGGGGGGGGGMAMFVGWKSTRLLFLLVSLGGYGLWFVKCMFTLPPGVIGGYGLWFVKCTFTLSPGVIGGLWSLVCKVHVYFSSWCHCRAMVFGL